MNCGSNALFVESWGQTHLHIHHPPLLHLDYPGSPPSHIRFYFLMVAAKARGYGHTTAKIMYKTDTHTKTPKGEKQGMLSFIADKHSYRTLNWQCISIRY